MKNYIFFLAVALLISSNIKAQDLQTYYYFSSYFNPENGPYIETYMTVVGNSATFIKNENGKYQASIEITIIFKQQGDVKDFRKYVLKSPEINSMKDAKPNFIDQQRISLPEGIYNFEMKVKDLNIPEAKEYAFFDIIKLQFPPNEIIFSGLEFIENYSPTEKENILSKNGYDLVPYVADFFPSNIIRFIYYLEIYHTDQLFSSSEPFLLKYYIEDSKTKTPINEFAKVKKQEPAPVIPLFGEFMIENLPTGNYNFVVEVRDRENNLKASKSIFFQRSNPKVLVDWKNLDVVQIEQTFAEAITNKDSLIEFIRYLYPISDAVETGYAKDMIDSGDVKLMQKYFYSFWKSRNTLAPEKEWLAYKEQVNFVNKKYKSIIKKGYETDRGRVYLQYGAPDNVIESKHEPSAYPYEIWHYYVLGTQRNKKFVFYSPDMVTNDYQLLHSDARGEIYDKNWERRLSQRNNTLYNPDAQDSDSQWGSRAKENFNK